MNHQIADARSAFALIAAAACWGIATVITKNVLTSIPPLTLLTLQLTVSVSLLWTVVYFKNKGLPGTSESLSVGLIGLLNPGISYTLSLLGLTTTTASMSTLLWASEPVLILGLAWLMLGEKVTLPLVTFSTIAIGGVILVGGFATDQAAVGTMTGNLLILGGVLCCAFYTVLARSTRTTTDPLSAVALQQTFALLWAFAIWPLELRSEQAVNLFQLGLVDWFWAGLSGIIYYALAFWFYLQGLTRVSATLAGAFINLIPLFGIGGAYLFLAERLAPLQWIGAGAILLAVFAILLWQEDATEVSSLST